MYKFNVGDKVKIKYNAKKIQESIDNDFGWCDSMNCTLGKIGIVAFKDIRGYRVVFNKKNSWSYVAQCLEFAEKRIPKAFFVGDKVEILPSARKTIIKLGKRGPGYDKDMDKHIGKVGEIVEIHYYKRTPYFDIRFNNDDVYQYHRSCLKLMENKSNEKVRFYKGESKTIRDIPETQTKKRGKIDYFISLDVPHSNYKDACDRITNDGEILNHVGDRIPIKAKVTIDIRSIDDSHIISDLCEDLQEQYDAKNIEIDDVKGII